MRKIGIQEIEKINELYRKYGTYAAVARELGIAPSTVKKYVSTGNVHSASPIKNSDEFKPVRLVHLSDLPKFDIDSFEGRALGDLCVITDEEMENIKSLWEEILA